VSPIGIGAWSWGDRTGYWQSDKNENLDAYKACLDNGISFFDTSEVYGFGQSEQYLEAFMRATGTQPVIATKFAPLPWRFQQGNVVSACKASLERLGIKKLGLYMIHWPGFPVVNSWADDNFVKGLADCHDMGFTQAVGVSNFRSDRIRQAQKILGDRGIPLASNQVQYSLLYRKPERNGVLDACKEGGTTLVAYSPLAQGLLTGKYTEDNLPSGPRKATITAARVRQVTPLLNLMKEIGSAHNKTQAQVAINWTICKGALPIPGARNAKQAASAAGGFGWRMSDDEVAALDRESAKVPDALGAPFETW
jgi:aryl-alcohol dehydrogenase-like predicted oxidoreductase